MQNVRRPESIRDMDAFFIEMLPIREVLCSAGLSSSVGRDSLPTSLWYLSAACQPDPDPELLKRLLTATVILGVTGYR